ncbi:hypothetical protein AB0D34_28265 [Streptomyces sp. NPDC048420]|uniref:hypothetical protein n=1 Tax=Streptomyces sp. NPDC048420 TaxID=3155755 RepID=UPI00341A8253
MGRHDEAMECHEQAFALLEALFEDHWKTRFRSANGETCRLAGRPDQALDLAPKPGHRHAETLAHEGIAAVLDETAPTAAAEHRAAGWAALPDREPAD